MGGLVLFGVRRHADYVVQRGGSVRMKNPFAGGLFSYAVVVYLVSVFFLCLLVDGADGRKKNQRGASWCFRLPFCFFVFVVRTSENIRSFLHNEGSLINCLGRGSINTL